MSLRQRVGSWAVLGVVLYVALDALAKAVG